MFHALETAPDVTPFFGTLAQVSMSLVAFQGGFLLMQLQSLMNEWRTLHQELTRLEQDEAAITAASRNAGWPAAEASHAASELEHDVIIRQLTPLWLRRDRAKIPREVYFQFVMLATLFYFGVWRPMQMLHAPSESVRLSFLTPVAAIMGLLWLAMLVASHNTLRILKAPLAKRGTPFSQGERRTWLARRTP